MGNYLVHLSWILYILVFKAVRYASPEVVLVELASQGTPGGDVYKGALLPNGLTLESTPLKDTRNVRELIYDSQDEQVYWIDAVKKTINAAFTDGSNFRTLYTLSPDSYPNCISLDPYARLLYYADSGENVIGVVSVEGSYHHTLFYNLDKPTHLALDTKNGFLYWVMAGSTPGIYKGPTCGTRKDPVITGNVQKISGLALDINANKLFWSDSSTGKLEESTMDGGSRKVLWEDPHLAPTGITLGEDGLYLVDKNTRHLFRFRSGPATNLGEKRFMRFFRTGLKKRDAGNATDADNPDQPPVKPVTTPSRPVVPPSGEKNPVPVESGPVKKEGIPGGTLRKPAPKEQPQQEGAVAQDAPPETKAAGEEPKLGEVKDAAAAADPPPTIIPTTTTTTTTTTVPPTIPPPLQKVKVMGMTDQTMMNLWTSIVRRAPGPCGRDNGQCSHFCFPHPVKGHMCACPDGMTMDKEKKSCTHDVEYDPKKAYLVFTQKPRGDSGENAICTMELSSQTVNCRRPTPSTYGPIVFNSEGGKVYWVDETKRAVMSSKFDGKWPRSLFKVERGSTITDLKVNGITQLLYLADSSKNEILEADMTHPYAERIIKTNLEEPRSIVVGKEFYWSEWGKVPKILKAELSPGKMGTSVVVLEKDLAQPTGLQIDYKDSALYWLDRATSKVERLDLKTNDRKMLYHESDASLRSLASDDKYLYVTDWNSGFIKRIEKTGDNKVSKIGRVALGQLSHMLLYKHTVYDKDSGYGECGQLTPSEASKPDCYRQGTLMYCRAGCKAGFEHLPARVQDHRKLYICDEGKWTPNEPLPRCFETILGKGASVQGKMTFTTSKANCSSETYKKTMGHKARMIMLSNHYKMCSEQRCVLRDPKVTCWPTGEAEDGEGPAKISVNVVWRVMKGSPNDTVAELKEHLKDEMYHLVRTHMSVVVNGVTVPVNLGETFFDQPAAACETGEEMTFKGCVACEKGSFFDQYAAKCTKCPEHTYQDKISKQKCKPCPNGTFGNITGASNKSQCLDIDLGVTKDSPMGVFPNDVNGTSARANRQGDDGNETHLIVGIVICVVFFLIFIIILIILIRKRRRKSKQEAREKWAGDQIRRSLSDILKSSQLENGDAPQPEEESPPAKRREMDDVSIAPLAEEEDTFLGASTPNLLV